MLGLLTNTLDKSYAFTLVSDGNSPYYNIELKEIHVAGKPLKINPRVFGGKHGTILDSGTTYAYLPEAAFVAFKSAVSYCYLHICQCFCNLFKLKSA